MKTLLFPAALTLVLFSNVSHAALYDLTQFSVSEGNGSIRSSVNQLDMVSNQLSSLEDFAASAAVVSARSFEFQITTPPASYASASVDFGQGLQSLIPPSIDPNTSWQPYFLPAPFTGTLTFHTEYFPLNNNNTSAVFSIRNLQVADAVPTVPAVPEPETYAMLLAGLGVMAAVARRRTHTTRRP